MNENRNQNLSNVLAAAVASIAIIALYGWVFKIPLLVQFFPSTAPMQANTALCLFFQSAAAILFHTDRSSRKLSFYLSLVTLIITSLTLLEYFFQFNFGIDAFLARPFITTMTSHPGRMSPNTATGLLLIAISQLFIFSPMRRHFIVASIFGLSGGTLGLVALAGYGIGLEGAYHWANYTRVAPQTALCLCIISLASILKAYSPTETILRNRLYTAAFASLVSGLTLTFLLWAAAATKETEEIKSLLQLDAQIRMRLIRQTLNTSINALQDIGRFFNSSQEVTRQEFKSFVYPLATQNSGLMGIDWAPKVLNNDKSYPLSYPVLFTEPQETNIAALGFDHYAEQVRKKTIDRATQEQKPIITEPKPLTQQKSERQYAWDFTIFSPVFVEPSDAIDKGSVIETSDKQKDIREIRGFVVGTINLDRVVKEAFRDIPESLVQIEFRDSEISAGPIWTYKPRSEALTKEREMISTPLFYSEEISIAGRTWQLTFLPTESYLRNLRTWFPWTILLGGILLTLGITSYILFLVFRNQAVTRLVTEQTSEIRLLNENLERTIEERTKALISSEAEFKSAFQNASIGMALVGLDGRWLRVNKPLLALVGYSEKELLQKTFQEITHPEDLEADIRFLRRVLGGEIDSYEMEKRYFHKAGHIVWVLLSVSLVRDGTGHPMYFISQIQDISARKYAEEALQEAKREAEISSRAKAEFLANMSHEIRTPLTSIIGYTDSLLRHETTEEESNFALETVARNSRHLLGVINDILDFSKIEAGKLNIESLEVPLFELIEDVGNLMQQKATEQGIAFGFHYEFPLPKTIRTDPTRLKQILFNLIGNAIKFTKKGGVKVSLSFERHLEELKFAITDTGIGMTPEQRAKLFQAFTQGDTSTTREFGGTGLGLVISHKLAQTLGGRIDVTSIKGHGSTFCLLMKTEPIHENNLITAVPRTTQHEAIPQIAPKELHGKILVAEDGRDNQTLLAFILRKAKIHFEIVENGDLAVQAMENGDFDLILMDMQMPVMDGYTATRKIREKGCEIPIIALTANVLKEDITRCLTAGCTDFIGKPFERNTFLEKIAGYLQSPSQHHDMKTTQECLLDLIGDEAVTLLENFHSRLPERIIEITSALEQENLSMVALYAHRLRGAGMFGYSSLGEAARVLEKCAVSSALEETKTALEELKRICNQILESKLIQEQRTATNFDEIPL